MTYSVGLAVANDMVSVGAFGTNAVGPASFGARPLAPDHVAFT